MCKDALCIVSLTSQQESPKFLRLECVIPETTTRKTFVTVLIRESPWSPHLGISEIPGNFSKYFAEVDFKR